MMKILGFGSYSYTLTNVIARWYCFLDAYSGRPNRDDEHLIVTCKPEIKKKIQAQEHTYKM